MFPVGENLNPVERERERKEKKVLRLISKSIYSKKQEEVEAKQVLETERALVGFNRYQQRPASDYINYHNPQSQDVRIRSFLALLNCDTAYIHCIVAGKNRIKPHGRLFIET